MSVETILYSEENGSPLICWHPEVLKGVPEWKLFECLETSSSHRRDFQLIEIVDLKRMYSLSKSSFSYKR